MEEKEFNQLNVIPLVDIMLVLLTIVLVTATFIAQGSLPIKLPSAKYSESKHLRTYKVVINKSGEVFFEDKKVNLTELRNALSRIPKTSAISIYADKRASVEALVSVLDVLKGLKMKKVFITTQVLR
ncbi:MAG: biopolymer transporter ExbD [Thermodesulfobacteria bacterium]|nr:biopolymer transporter ExbD [Thermodesulfobacteriota bacterium]